MLSSYSNKLKSILNLLLLMDFPYTNKLLKNYLVQEYIKEYISVTTTLLNQDIHFSKISYEQSVVSRNSVTYPNTSMAGCISTICSKSQEVTSIPLFNSYSLLSCKVNSIIDHIYQEDMQVSNNNKLKRILVDNQSLSLTIVSKVFLLIYHTHNFIKC